MYPDERSFWDAVAHDAAQDNGVTPQGLGILGTEEATPLRSELGLLESRALTSEHSSHCHPTVHFILCRRRMGMVELKVEAECLP